MLAARELAAVKIAVEICNKPEVKSEILLIPRLSEYRAACVHEEVKNLWEENLVNKTHSLLDELCLVTRLREEVFELVLLTGMRMLKWATYHEGIIGFSRQFTINFMDCSIFTSRGLIDNKIAAIKLLECQCLPFKQKYKVACIYCFVDEISYLFRRMSKENKLEVYAEQGPFWIMQHPLIKFWSYSEMKDVDTLRGNKTSSDYLLEIAAKSGIKEAVEYCLVGTEESRMGSTLMSAAMGAIHNRKRQCRHAEYDCVVFQEWKYDFSDDSSWIPSDFFIDLLYFLCNKMTDNQLIKFFRQDLGTENIGFIKSVVYRVFTWFLNWPYQDFILKAGNLIWEFLPEMGFACLLVEISGKIEAVRIIQKSARYVVNNTYDYRKLLKEFWCMSPPNFKRFIFSRDDDRNVCFNGCKAFLGKLLSLRNFTNEDRSIFELVLASGTEEEKINMIHCKEGEFLCLTLLKKEKWGILDMLMSNCLTTSDQVKNYQKCLSITKGAQELFIYFAEKQNWKAVELFLKWSSLSEEEVVILKGQMILSGEVMKACKDIIEFQHSVKFVKDLCEWVFTSTDELKVFLKELVASYEVLKSSKELILKNKLEEVNELITWCLSSEAEISEFKEGLAKKWGLDICQYNIDYSTEDCLYIFNWELVDKFLTWCFSSEDKINNFKRRMWVEKSALDIIFKLIFDNQWQEAEKFVSWLGLSPNEMIEVRKQSLYENMDRINTLIEITDPNLFMDYMGGKWDNVECIISWCLKDKEAILEFQEKYQEEYGYGPSQEEEWYKLPDAHKHNY